MFGQNADGLGNIHRAAAAQGNDAVGTGAQIALCGLVDDIHRGVGDNVEIFMAGDARFGDQLGDAVHNARSL
ncbi:hypothetical protein SDC9_139568 [bioreactor metagenome]|uniref:Uncharacterized protein n=1 Tax=bioreactor metagenome TaxID=1076179 RepID=A0A645DV20_9ZZZZ